MALPGEVEDTNEESIKGSAPELHVVEDTRGVEKTEGEPLSEGVKEYKIQGPTEEGEARRAEEARIAKEDRYKADDEFGETVEKSDREDARERSWIRKVLGLKAKK